MATVWWWVVPNSEAGASTRPSDAKLISTPNSGAQYNAFDTNGSYGGYTRFQGPFTSQAEAQAASPTGGSTGQVIAAGVGAGNAAAGAVGLPAIPTSVSNPLDFLQSIGDFFHRLTELNTWIRLGKIVLGGALLLIGLAHMTGADNKVMNAARNVKVLPI